MFQLDDKFLQELGLDQMPEDQKQDYRQVVASVLDELKREIMGSREAILGADQAA